MELNELNVIDLGRPRARPWRHHRRSRRPGLVVSHEYAAESTGGEKDGAGANVAQHTRFLVENHGAGHAVGLAVVCHQKVGYGGVAFKADVRDGSGFAIECAGDFASGGNRRGRAECGCGCGRLRG